LNHHQTFPGLDHLTPAAEQWAGRGPEKVDGEVGGEDRLPRPNQSGGSSASGVVGKGRDHSRVDIPMLLTKAGGDRELGLEPVGAGA
jgi:hypothetical protein